MFFGSPRGVALRGAPAQNRTEKSSLEGTRYIRLPTGAKINFSHAYFIRQTTYLSTLLFFSSTIDKHEFYPIIAITE